MNPPPSAHVGFLPGRHAISAFGQGGFRFGDMSHRGSILALPSGIRRWEVADPFRHDERIYAGVFAEAHDIDLLLIGSGAGPVPLPDSLRLRFREAGISVDTTTTAIAASTYNVLLGEGRRVAAALVAVP